MKIYFVPGNENKLNEAKKILPEIEGLNIDLIEIQSIDSQEIIEHKLNEAKKHHSGNFVVEDTSLELVAMKGLPGPLIKFFEKSILILFVSTILLFSSLIFGRFLMIKTFEKLA